MDASLKSAVDEAASVLRSVGRPETAPPHCLMRKAGWFPDGDGRIVLHCELDVPDPADVEAVHGAAAGEIAREMGVGGADEARRFLSKMHSASARSSVVEWASSSIAMARSALSNTPFETEDGRLFKACPNPHVTGPAIDEEDGDSRIIAFAVDVEFDFLPEGAYREAEAACDARFPGWRSFPGVDFEPGVDEGGAYLDSATVVGGRVWNVWVAEMPGGIDAGIAIGAKGAGATFAKKQGFKSFPQCASWVSSVLEGIAAGAYEDRVRATEGRPW